MKAPFIVDGVDQFQGHCEDGYHRVGEYETFEEAVRVAREITVRGLREAGSVGQWLGMGEAGLVYDADRMQVWSGPDEYGHIKPRMELALRIAMEAHMDQIDKGGEPYIFHPLRVAERVAGNREKTVAFLHDVIEDSEQHTIESLTEVGFPEDITDALDALTKREREPYKDYLARVRSNALATVVKIADLGDNVDISRLHGPPGKDDLARLDKYKYELKYLNDT